MARMGCLRYPLEDPTKIVGIEIVQAPRKISISQKRSIENILEQQGLTNANPVRMPFNPNVKILPNPDRNEGNWSNSFTELLGELQYIAFAVNRLASYTANPSMQHVTVLKRILHYLSGTREHGITYKYSSVFLTFKGFADAVYKDREDGKSTTGYVFLQANGAIIWHSGKQDVTTQSSTEAEYIALWESGKEASWLWNLHRELGFSQQSPTSLICDNTGVVAITKNPTFHKQTKHIDSHYHWIREKIQAGRFDAKICCTANQTADVLTKAPPHAKDECHTTEIGVAPVWRGVLGGISRISKHICTQSYSTVYIKYMHAWAWIYLSLTQPPPVPSENLSIRRTLSSIVGSCIGGMGDSRRDSGWAGGNWGTGCFWYMKKYLSKSTHSKMSTCLIRGL